MPEEVIHLRPNNAPVGQYCKTLWNHPGKVKTPCAIHLDAYDEKKKEFQITVLYDGRKLTVGFDTAVIVITEEEANHLANLKREELAGTLRSTPPLLMRTKSTLATLATSPNKPMSNTATAEKTIKKPSRYGVIKEALLAGKDKDAILVAAKAAFPDVDEKKLKSDISVVRWDLKKAGKLSA